ncbi:alpha/beta fold hydrolase [Acidiphilium sp.]|uniref:alpha/beta fold hydrolase n=1 Tax=Acidiphilium sp. TaxID=527 RepID=UPI003D0704B6
MPTDVVFIPALLCDEDLYRDVITIAGDAIEARVMISPQSSLAASAADILSQAPPHFALVGTSYGGNLALEVALTAPERVTALWLMGCDPAGPRASDPDLASGLIAQPDAVIDSLAGLVVHPDATEAAARFVAMAHRIGGHAGAAQATALAARREVTSRLGMLHMPAMVLWGKNDAVVPLAIGRALADDLPHAHFHVLKDCGHLPTLERPVEAAALFIEFLTHEQHHHH